MWLLIVEDEWAIAEVMMLNLKRIGYKCKYAQDGEIGATMVEKQSCDLAPLDITLPKISGYGLMEYPTQPQIPIAFITVKGSVQDHVKGLHMGAGDYLMKPFAVDKLTARAESVLRRYHKSMQDVHVLDVTIHITTRLVEEENRTVALIEKEYELLLCLVQNKNIALYRDTMYEKVRHKEEFEQARTLGLRTQRLHKELNWRRVTQAVYRIGYVLEVRDEVQR